MNQSLWNKLTTNTQLAGFVGALLPFVILAVVLGILLKERALPDFTTLAAGEDRKKAFFQYLQPFVREKIAINRQTGRGCRISHFS